MTDVGHAPFATSQLGDLQERVEQRLRAITKNDIVRRIWGGDHTVWTQDPTEITHPNRLGWLEVHREMLGTTAIRPRGPKSPPHPAWLAGKYDSDATAQLFRVYVAREHRRRGAARALVQFAAAWVAREPGYEVIYLHTNPDVPGAEAFWRSMPVTEIHGSL